MHAGCFEESRFNTMREELLLMLCKAGVLHKEQCRVMRTLAELPPIPDHIFRQVGL